MAAKPKNVVGSYIENFDEALGGGIPQGHIVLVYGSAGTMKSSVSFNILYNEIVNGKKGIYISVEQSSLSILRQIVGLNYDISKLNIEVLNDADDVLKGLSRLKDGEENKLTLIDFGTIRKQLKAQKKGKGSKKVLGEKIGHSEDLVGMIQQITKTMVEKDLCDIVILDSLTAIYSLTELKDPRSEIFYLFEFFRDLGVTTFVISEENKGASSFSRFGIESYLADGIIHIQLTERNRKVTREISIVKMRATDCNNDVFNLEFDGKKFKALYGGKMPLV
jgi:KaiC/GvpD/RAD55 family RecA-like ATPase